MYPSPYPAPFNSAHVRATIVKILLIAGAIVGVLEVLSEAFSLATPPLTDEQEIGDNPMGVAIALIIFLLAVLTILIYVATVVFFLVWLYRASDNVSAFGYPRNTRDYSPGWAVGSFFIPFVNLVVPYRAVKEVWQKSVPPEETFLGVSSPPALFPFWWLFWLLASFAGNISMRMSFNESVPESTATIVSIIAGVLSIIAAVLAYFVVNEIDKRQEETTRKLNFTKSIGPPPAPVNLSFPDPAMRQ